LWTYAVEGKGTHFDPYMVDAFVEITDEFREIAKRYED
jgi:putative two-component system response regulator